MTIHVDIADIIFVNFGPHFHFWQLKNSRCQKCHALGKIKSALENNINDYSTNILKRKSFATHIKRKFLPIDYKISFGDKWYGKSCSLSSIQHANQNAAAYGC